MSFDSFHIANAVLDDYFENFGSTNGPIAMTNNRLNMLIYLIDNHYRTLTGEPLTIEPWLAHPYRPRLYSISSYFVDMANSPLESFIHTPAEKQHHTSAHLLSMVNADIKLSFTTILDATKHTLDDDLRAIITADNTPWHKARGNKEFIIRPQYIATDTSYAKALNII